MKATHVGDFGAYLVIALALGFGALWLADHWHGMPNDFILKWGGLSANTAILYGYFIRWSKRYWHVLGFWLATVSVLIIHLLVFIVILQRVEHWGALVPSDVSH